ncbi:hypothetical protein BCR43DRAFT_502299 [Syncephalastrum racemosum]|uniref:Kinetochore protein Spc24 n=1 Tax=Syncephalastrum racemosum TaxID=13706 RepID=A0A1X2HMK7_SYNRA|nr:hypothetical protein BCR43DRAFT_502299 [Syncephalastrum racemosum]
MAVHSKDVLEAIETIHNSDALQSLQLLKDHTAYITQHSTTLPRQEEERKTRASALQEEHRALEARKQELIQAVQAPNDALLKEKEHIEQELAQVNESERVALETIARLESELAHMTGRQDEVTQDADSLHLYLYRNLGVDVTEKDSSGHFRTIRTVSPNGRIQRITIAPGCTKSVWKSLCSDSTE